MSEKTITGKPCTFCGKQTRQCINHSRAVHWEKGEIVADEPERWEDIPYYSCDGCGFRYTAEEARL